MRIVIIEDEEPARKHLVSLLSKVQNEFEVIFEAPSVRKAVEGFEQDQPVDLVFMDIQLNDGLSFELFDYVDLKAPVIFTTAYDQYMLEAFQSNGIDYLLKPIKLGDLKAAIGKFHRLGDHFGGSREKVKELALGFGPQDVLSRILVRQGVHYRSVPVEEVAYFFSEQKVTFLVDRQQRRYMVDIPLTELEGRTPASFFRVNRKYLVTIDAIDRFKSIGQGRLAVTLVPDAGEEVQVSQEKAGAFKQWVGG